MNFDEDLIALGREAVSCFPRDVSSPTLYVWTKGETLETVFTVFDGDVPTSSDELNDLALTLFEKMAEEGYVWIACAMQFTFLEEQKSWKFHASFGYESPEPSNVSDPDAKIKDRVTRFWSDYHAWCIWSMGDQETDPSLDSVEEAYRHLVLDKHVVPGKETEPLAFGFPPDHDPNSEKIDRIERADGKAFVHTTRTVVEEFSIVHRYRYDLVERDGDWLLEEVNYVAEDGLYPSL